MFKKLPTSPIAKVILTPFSLIYGIIINIRNLLYDKKILKTFRFSKPVISIGNITVGGTGKTPFTITLGELLIQHNFKVGIVSRGYKRQSKEQIVVSDGEGNINPPLLSGDEPFLIAQKLPQAVVIVDEDRVRATQTAFAKYNCDVVIADDAFQHRRLGRSIDIVLWDPYLRPRKQKLLPTGRLREPYKALKRANCLILTKTDHISYSKAAFFAQFNPNMIITAAPLKILHLIHPATNQILPPNFITHKRVVSFCGLGNHRQFFENVDKLNPKSQIEVEFPDHYVYQLKDIELLQNMLYEHQGDYLITTEKDLVNLPPQALTLPELLILVVKLEIEPYLEKYILEKLFPQ